MQTIIDRSLTPATKEIEEIQIPQAKKYTLDNGIPVYSISAGFQELVKVELIFFNNEFDASRPLLNSATNRMLSEGTSKFTSSQLADHIDYFGAFYETDENADFTSVMLYTLNKHLESTLPFIADIIHDPVFPQKELDIYSRNNRQRLIVDNEKVSSVARRKFNEVIFGNKHAYGYYVMPDDFTNIKRDDLLDHYKKKYHPSNCTIIISGLIKESAIEALNRHFGKQASGQTGRLEKINKSFNPSSENKHFFEKEGAVQSALRIGKPFFNRKHADYPGMAVLNTIFGGFFGSRLMSNIREDKGYTYGIGSAIVSMRQEGYFFISTEVGAEVTKSALGEIYKEIELIKNELVNSEELEIVRNYMLGTFLKSMDGPFQLAERFKSIYLYDLDYSYYDRYLQIVRTIQPEELQQLARRYFDTSGFFEVVVGTK
jgi:predicted Zn-dependent peptidase